MWSWPRPYPDRRVCAEEYCANAYESSGPKGGTRTTGSYLKMVSEELKSAGGGRIDDARFGGMQRKTH
jgi:hypothetical protein